MPFQVYESHEVITSNDDELFKMVKSRVIILSHPLILTNVSIYVSDESNVMPFQKYESHEMIVSNVNISEG